MKASLPTAIKVANQYLNSDNWIMQQKLDGWRVLVETGDTTSCFNRDGYPLDIPVKSLGVLNDMSTHWIFDCEYLEAELWVFDILETPTGDIRHFPLRKRLELLSNLKSKFQSPLHAVPSFYGDNKKKILEEFKDTRKEGVIFKHLDSPYLEGRNKKILKYKFTKHVDCIIIDKNVDSKQNFALGMLRGDEIEEVGMVSALTGDGPKIDIGDVVQVNILYATKDNRLYQPVKPMLRIDKTPEQCTIDQLLEMRTDRTPVSPP